MTPAEINNIFDGFQNQRALIIGDVMIDAYYWGNTERISPEAPVPVVSVSNSESRLGGAANVALNVQALGAAPILCSVIGKDAKGDEFLELLQRQGLSTEGIVQFDSRQTTVKTRIISQQQHLLRIDEEMSHPLLDLESEALVKRIAQLIQNNQIDVIIFEDYDKGVITPQLIEAVVQLAKVNSIPTTVDPKKRNFLAFSGVTLFKPNLKELREGLNTPITNRSAAELDQAAHILQEELGIAFALITLSELGVYTYNGSKGQIIPAHIRDISDVSGAGDTVIAVASLCLAQGVSIHTLAGLANLAGGLVCEKVGVVPIDKENLRKEAQKLMNQ